MIHHLFKIKFCFWRFLLLRGEKNPKSHPETVIFMTADTSGGYERCLHSFPFLGQHFRELGFGLLCCAPLFFLEEQASLASVLFCWAITQDPPLRHLVYKQFWEARIQSGQGLVQGGIYRWQNSDSNVHSKEGSPVVCFAAGPKENMPAPLSSSPSLMGVVSNWAPIVQDLPMGPQWGKQLMKNSSGLICREWPLIPLGLLSQYPLDKM